MRMNRRSAALLLAGALLGRVRESWAAEVGKNDGPAPTPSDPATLPKDIVWETNNDDPLIGSPKAVRGGTLNVSIGAYPLTFRVIDRKSVV